MDGGVVVAGVRDRDSRAERPGRDRAAGHVAGHVDPRLVDELAQPQVRGRRARMGTVQRQPEWVREQGRDLQVGRFGLVDGENEVQPAPS